MDTIEKGAILKDRESGAEFTVTMVSAKRVHYAGNGEIGDIARDQVDKEYEVLSAVEQQQSWMAELLESKLPPYWTGQVGVRPHVVLVGGSNDNRFGIYAVEKFEDDVRETLLTPVGSEAAVTEALGILDRMAVQRGLSGVQRLEEENNIMREAVQEEVTEPENAFRRAETPSAAEQAQAAAAEAVAGKPKREIPQTLLNGRFVRDAVGNYHRPGEDMVALVDEDDQIRFIDKQLDTFQAAVELAKNKGWDAIEVTGSDRFRSDAWLVAREAGLQVVGYEPTEKDLNKLRDMEIGREASKAFTSHTQQAPPTIDNMDPWVDSKQAAEDYVLNHRRDFGGLTGVNDQFGRYVGNIVHETAHHFVQSLGKSAVVHDKERFEPKELRDLLASTKSQGIRYVGGKASVEARAQQQEKSYSFGGR